jgi:hypothetical protein
LARYRMSGNGSKPNLAHAHSSPVIAPTLDLPTGASVSQTALILPTDLALADWETLGVHLQQREDAIKWWIADWWVYGDHTYGKRAEAVAKGTFKYTLGTLMTYGVNRHGIRTPFSG